MNTSGTPKPVLNLESSEVFGLASPQSLSATARDARDAMLGPLQVRMAGRRTRRLVTRTGTAFALVILLIAGVRLLPWTHAPVVSIPRIAVNPLPRTDPAAVDPKPSPVPRFSVSVLRDDPAIAARYRTPSSPHAKIERLTDEQLFAALEAAGTPGYIRIGGRVVLSRDLDQPKPADPEPRSSLAPVSSHG